MHGDRCGGCGVEVVVGQLVLADLDLGEQLRGNGGGERGGGSCGVGDDQPDGAVGVGFGNRGSDQDVNKAAGVVAQNVRGFVHPAFVAVLVGGVAFGFAGAVPGEFP